MVSDILYICFCVIFFIHVFYVIYVEFEKINLTIQFMVNNFLNYTVLYESILNIF